MSDDTSELRLATLESNHTALATEIRSTDPERPGLSLRVYRIEQFMRSATWFIGVIGGVAILWKVIDAVITYAVSLAGPGP